MTHSRPFSHSRQPSQADSEVARSLLSSNQRASDDLSHGRTSFESEESVDEVEKALEIIGFGMDMPLPVDGAWLRLIKTVPK